MEGVALTLREAVRSSGRGMADFDTEIGRGVARAAEGIAFGLTTLKALVE